MEPVRHLLTNAPHGRRPRESHRKKSERHEAPENRLPRRVSHTATSAATGACRHDPFGRRVARSAEGTTTWFVHDGDGNATQYVDSSGTVVAHYEYDPFGHPLSSSSGTLAGQLKFRFSTKHTDDETGFSY